MATLLTPSLPSSSQHSPASYAGSALTTTVAAVHSTSSLSTPSSSRTLSTSASTASTMSAQHQQQHQFLNHHHQQQLPLPVSPPCTPPVCASPTRRAIKHCISFLLDAPPPSSSVTKRRRLQYLQSSPVSIARSPSPSPVPASTTSGPSQLPPPPSQSPSQSTSTAPVNASESVHAEAVNSGTTNVPAHIQCSECSFVADSQDSIITHARISHPSKPFACRTCGRCFGEKGNMNKHYRTVHLKQRKHQCGICSRQFAFLDGLNRHISMVHLDRRPFECTECQCPGGWHSESIPCSHVCGMRFKQKSHRRRHIRSVHQAAPPARTQCPSCSKIVSDLRTHSCTESVAAISTPTVRGLPALASVVPAQHQLQRS